MSVIRVFDKNGLPLRLGEMDALVNRCWVLNGIGSATITLAKTAIQCTEVVLRFGNRVLIQEDDMSAWGGIILPPRRWGADSVEITVYTIEKLLEHRQITADCTGYAGTIFSSLLSAANTTEDTLIDEATLYEDGESWTEETHSDIYAVMASIAKRSGQDWAIEPYINATGNLAWYAYWYEQRGEDLSETVTLEEGVHFALSSSGMLSEQGPIYNSITLEAYDGVGATTSATAEDEDSIALYGTLEGFLSETLPSGYTAQTYCDHLLEIYKEPRRVFTLAVINDDIDTLKYLRLGNTIRIILVNYGFTGIQQGLTADVRITSMQADERDSTLTLVVKEV